MSQPKHVAAPTATFGEVFGVGEFRALYTASALSWLGDYLARAAVTALVYRSTGSVALSATSFAVSYLPGLTAGPILAALAERYPRRTAMVFCDLARACAIAVVAIPSMHVSVLLILLFAAALLNSPFDASRSALLAQIMTGDRYLVALSLQNTTNNTAMVVGYFVGGLAASKYPHATLAIDAGTFVVSALCVGFGTKPRRAALSQAQRTGLFRETMAGFTFVTGNPLLRAIAVLSLGATLLAIVPEGLAAAWAGRIAIHDHHQQGLDQALIMMSIPVGTIVGSIVVGRFVSPVTRRSLIKPFALVLPIALGLALLNPSAVGITAIGVVIGFAISALFLPSNALYAQALPSAFRARAFGVFQFGAQFVQAFGLIVTGLLADHFPLHDVVGAWGIGGIVLMVIAITMWPSSPQIDRALAEARAINATIDGDEDSVDTVRLPVGRAHQTGYRPRPWPSPRPSPIREASSEAHPEVQS